MRVASLLAGRGLTLSAFILKNGFSMQRSRHSFNEPQVNRVYIKTNSPSSWLTSSSRALPSDIDESNNVSNG